MNNVEKIKKYFGEHLVFSWVILFFVISSFAFGWFNDLFDFKEKLFPKEDTKVLEAVITDLTNKDLLEKIFNIKIKNDTLEARNEMTKEMTKIEKIVNFTLEDNIARCVVIFGTYQFDEDNKLFDCHFCAPKISLATFKKNAFDKWQLLKIEKNLIENGGWGSIGEIKLEKIGKNRFGLICKDGYTQQGETSSFYTIVDLEEAKIIFSEEISSNNGGAFNNKTNKYFSYLFKIKNNKSDITNEFYPFCLKFEEKKGEILKKEVCFEYNYTKRQYEIK